MSVREKLAHFWNVTLGPDYTDETLEQAIANDASLQELAESQARLNKMETSYGNNTGKKGGKGNGGKEIVQKVDVSSKVVEPVKEEVASNKEEEMER